MLKIIWRNSIGYIVERGNGYRVYYGHMDGIIKCYHLTDEGLTAAKQNLIEAQRMSRLDQIVYNNEAGSGFL